MEVHISDARLVKQLRAAHAKARDNPDLSFLYEDLLHALPDDARQHLDAELPRQGRDRSFADHLFIVVERVLGADEPLAGYAEELAKLGVTLTWDEPAAPPAPPPSPPLSAAELAAIPPTEIVAVDAWAPHRVVESPPASGFWWARARDRISDSRVARGWLESLHDVAGVDLQNLPLSTVRQPMPAALLDGISALSFTLNMEPAIFGQWHGKPNLRFVAASQLSEEFLAFLASLPALEALDLGDTFEVPDDLDLTSLSTLRTVTRLRLSAWSEAIAAALGAWSSLETIDLREADADIGAEAAALAGLPALRRLRLGSGTQPEALEAISGAPHLVELDLENCYSTDADAFAAVARLPRLERLALPEQAVGVVPALVAAPSLTDLVISEFQLDEPAFDALARMPALARVTVHAYSVDAARARLPRVAVTG